RHSWTSESYHGEEGLAVSGSSGRISLEEDDDSGSEYEPPQQQRRSMTSRPATPIEHHSYESVKLAQYSRAAAARERQAFGIPPSASDELCEELPKSDSVLSTVESSERWEEGDEEELSFAAEALFRKLSGSRRPEPKVENRQRSGSDSRRPPEKVEPP